MRSIYVVPRSPPHRNRDLRQPVTDSPTQCYFQFQLASFLSKKLRWFKFVNAFYWNRSQGFWPKTLKPGCNGTALCSYSIYSIYDSWYRQEGIKIISKDGKTQHRRLSNQYTLIKIMHYYVTFPLGKYVLIHHKVTEVQWSIQRGA